MCCAVRSATTHKQLMGNTLPTANMCLYRNLCLHASWQLCSLSPAIDWDMHPVVHVSNVVLLAHIFTALQARMMMLYNAVLKQCCYSG